MKALGRPRQWTDREILEVARECFLNQGPSVSTVVIAERLGMSYMPFVTSIKPAGDSLIVRRNGPTSLLELSVSLPAAVTVERGINEPRGLSLLAASRVMGRKVPYWTSEDLNTEDSQTGELGSCLRLARVQAPPKRKIKRRQGGQILRGSPEVLAEILVERLKEWHAL